MLLLRIIDTNQNNYFPQKVENFSMQKIHYGGASELKFTLEENPSFQNHKVGLFNQVHLYNFSNLIWQGYITKFQRDFTKSNFTLKASGLLTDFTNKRIKKTYVLDDIGDFKNWNEKDNKQSDEILYGYSQATDEKGVKISLLQRSYNAEEDGLFELKIDENIERLKARILLSQPANFTTKLVTLDENHSNPDEEKKWENAQKIDEDVILDITKEATGSGTFTKDIFITKDSWVQSNSPNTNHGSFHALLTNSFGGSFDYRAFLYCPTTDIPANATIISATLYMHCSVLYKAATNYLTKVNADWGEYTITFNNQPAVWDDINSFYNTSLGEKTVDITTAFKNWWDATWANYGFRMHHLVLNGDNAFHSREGVNKPFVRVKYSTPEGDVEVNKRYLQFRVECTANETISTDKYFAQLENLKLLTTDNEINAANILKDLLLNHTQKLDLNTTLIQDCFNYKNIELCESLTDWAISDKLTTYNLNANPSIEVDIAGYVANLGATLSRDIVEYYHRIASLKCITDNAAAGEGWQRDITAESSAGTEYTYSVYLKGAGTVLLVMWDNVSGATNSSIITLTSTWTRYNITKTFGAGSTLRIVTVQTNVQQGITFYSDIIMHTEGSTLYLYALTLSLENSIIKEGQKSIKTISENNSSGETLTKTLSPIQNLQNKNLFRLWVRSTITGNVLKAKFGENLKYQFEPEWSCEYEANEEPPAADPIWTLVGTDYGSVSGGILTINKTAANQCIYQRYDVGHNVKGNTIVTRMKCDNAAKTTHLILGDGIAETNIAIYSTKIEDYNDAANVYTIDMTKYRELWLTMKNNFFVLYVDGILAMVGETTIYPEKRFQFGMDGSVNLGKSYWDYVYYYNMSFLRNKRIEKTITIDAADTWEEIIIDLNNFPIATRDAIKYIQFEIATNDAFTFYIDQIRSNFELTSAYYRDRTAPLNILEDVLAYQDYEWLINKNRKVKFFEVDRDAIDYICPIKNLVFEENSVSYFNKIYLIYFDEMMKRQEIELTDETSKIPFDREHVIGLGGISDVGAKAIGEAQFSFHKKPRYQLNCLVDNFVFDKNGGVVKSVEIEPNNNVKFLGIKELPIFRIIRTDYSKGVCRLTLETEAETTPNIMKSIIGVL